MLLNVVMAFVPVLLFLGLLVLMDSAGVSLVDWSVDLAVIPVPPIKEIEPNDIRQTATVLGTAS